MVCPNLVLNLELVQKVLAAIFAVDFRGSFCIAQLEETTVQHASYSSNYTYQKQSPYYATILVKFTRIQFVNYDAVKRECIY
jgi:hypothetical protein